MQRKWFGKLGVLLLALSLITACNMDNNGDNGDMNEGPLNQQEDQDGNQNNNGDQNQQDGEDNLNDNNQNNDMEMDRNEDEQ
ncbi:MAG TPA: hypothetical protein VK119_12590 [Bacillota bacterium]|nr:hypothetical protein [Bacillota bacterium]